MSRAKAIEWLFWHHAREGWERFHAYPHRRLRQFDPFPLERPKPDGFWSIFCG